VVNKKRLLHHFLITQGDRVKLDDVNKAYSRVRAERPNECRFWYGDVEVVLHETTSDYSEVRVKQNGLLLSQAATIVKVA